jgi:hypothetical protein
MEALTVTENKIAIKELKKLQGLVRLIQITDNIPLRDLLGSEGNRKIPSSTAIFNMTPAKFCPSRKLGLCKAEKQGAKCYADKAERLYPKTALPYRIRQMDLWKNINAKEFAKQFILINATKKNGGFTALRFNECGDFITQACIDKAEEIARLLHLQGIKTYCYSSRSDLDFSKCKNLIISGSNFTKTGINNIFKIIKNKKEKPRGWAMCRMDCHICKLCQIRGNNICVLKH